jgi:hypothetical protein
MVPKFNSIKESQTASVMLMQLKHEKNSKIPPYFNVVESNNKLKGSATALMFQLIPRHHK